MKFSTIIWGGENPYTPESPNSILQLAFIYRSIKKINTDWYILVLEGYEKYQHIADQLKQFNCYLIDVNAIYINKLKKYEKIYQLYADNKYRASTQFKNTVRLLVAHEFFGGDAFLNVDADLIVNEEPDLIVNQHESLYMGSTCFVHINDKNFGIVYNELLNELVNNFDGYIDDCKKIADKHHPGQNAWSVMGNMPHNMGILEEGLFYVLSKRYRDAWTQSDNKYLYIPFMYDLYKELNKPTWKRVSTLNDTNNRYTFVDGKHYINSKPLAYMHYQYNFRFILSFYLLQKQLGVPYHFMYCPAMAHDMTPIRDDISSMLTKHTHHLMTWQKTFRQDLYRQNLIPDILICQLMNVVKDHETFGRNLFDYKNILQIEKTGELQYILNNDFWYSKNIFV